MLVSKKKHNEFEEKIRNHAKSDEDLKEIMIIFREIRSQHAIVQ
jgi:hypothetical protein